MYSNLNSGLQGQGIALPSLRQLRYRKRLKSFSASNMPLFYRFLQQNCMLLYDFGEGSGTQVRDLSGNGNHGTLTNFDTANCWNNAAPNGLNFDGVNDYIETASTSLNTVNELSVFTWVKLLTSGVYKQIATRWDIGVAQRIFYHYIANTNQYSVYVSTNGIFDAASAKSYTANATLNNTSMYHLGFTFNRGILELYINGIQQVVTKVYDASFSTIYTAAVPLTLGCRLNNGTAEQFSSMNIHSLLYMKQALNANEIKQIYQYEKRFFQ